jgi:hypothetical protein
MALAILNTILALESMNYILPPGRDSNSVTPDNEE